MYRYTMHKQVQTLECAFQTLEYKNQTLERTFQGLVNNIQKSMYGSGLTPAPGLP